MLGSLTGRKRRWVDGWMDDGWMDGLMGLMELVGLMGG